MQTLSKFNMPTLEIRKPAFLSLVYYDLSDETVHASMYDANQGLPPTQALFYLYLGTYPLLYVGAVGIGGTSLLVQATRAAHVDHSG